jgi:hypothetical protein
MQATAFHSPAGAASSAGLSRSTQARITAMRAERRAFDDARRRRAAEKPPLAVLPFEADRDPLIAAIAKRNAGEALALAGLVAFLLCALVAFALFGDAPGMATAAAGAGL